MDPQLIENHKLRLKYLERQAALLGPGCDVSILIEIDQIRQLLIQEGALVPHKGKLVEPRGIPQRKPITRQKFSEAKPSILVWLFASAGVIAACSEGTRTGNLNSFLMIFPNILTGMLGGAFYSFLLNLVFRQQLVFPLAFEFMFVRKHAPHLYGKIQSLFQKNPQLGGTVTRLTQQLSKVQLLGGNRSSRNAIERGILIALFAVSVFLMLL